MLKRLVALTVVLFALIAGAVTAEAAPSQANGDPSTQSASGCTGRTGPGMWNTNCIAVTGEGLYVEQIRGKMESVSGWPPLPHYICGVTVHTWGTLLSGAKYDRTGQAACGLGTAWVDFYPRTRFYPSSWVCSRTQWNGIWSNPACVQVY